MRSCMRFVMFTIYAILIHGIYILLALIKTKDSNINSFQMEFFHFRNSYCSRFRLAFCSFLLIFENCCAHSTMVEAF